ncbi:MAG: response regulator [Treponema sp.]|jgi:CheY-like chemotaxis protein|uniref:response regulator n=1 Tax=Treponema sp. TaxID=166 RepID=UPI002A90FE2C|nr:response regulator [Treponema sp.]MDY6398489.1 response regulator [Treponema sp.]
MERSILFVSEAQNFLVTAMIKSLKEARFDVSTAEPDMVEISLIQNIPDIYIVYLEGDLNKFNGTLKYLKKLVTEEGHDRVLYLIGNPMEIEAAYEVYPKSLVSSSFSRPVNIQDVIKKLNMLITSEEGGTPGRKKILVVDDDGVMLRTMKIWLSKKYEVYMANSGLNALQFLSSNHVDLILLDYEMPVASGLQIFEMLKHDVNLSNIPVIFLTSKDDKETVMKVLAAGPEKYLLKSSEPDMLLKTVDDFFKGK